MTDNMNVKNLVEGVYKGEIVLPDFQRSFVWEPEGVRELLVSVLGDYFIGAMLVLEIFKGDSPFALRLFEGVEKVNGAAKIQSIVKIILDGQQRTTALFYALYEPNIPLKGRKSAYKFYLDLEKALNGDWNDAVIGANIRDKRRLKEINSKNLVIPFGYIKEPRKIVEIFKDHPRFSEIYELVDSFLKRHIYVIKLSKDVDLEKIVETFERINRTGEPLSVFELLTARLYKYGIKLRVLLKNAESKCEVVKIIKPEFILKVITLIRGEEPKRRDILNLNHDNFENDWNTAVSVLNKAYKRATDIKNGYGVFDFPRWMPYTTMLVPLAAILNYIRVNKLETPENFNKIDKWYWISVFLNRYDQAVDTISYNDYNALKEWLKDDDKIPEFVKKFNINDIDVDVEKQGAATYRGVINLIVLNGALDFKTGQPPQFYKEKVQDDHIFPKSKYKVNSVINRTLISTNAAKGDLNPSKYFNERIKDYGKEKLKEILSTHLIPENAIDDLLTDNINDFLKKRKEKILDKIKEMIK